MDYNLESSFSSSINHEICGKFYFAHYLKISFFVTLIFQLLVALAFAAVVAVPEADAYYNRFPGYYNRNFNYYRGYGYSGYPFLEAQPTALIAPEDGAMYEYSYGYPSQYYEYSGSGYYGMPSGNFYGRRFWKRDAEAAAEAFNRYYEYSGYNRWGGYPNNWYSMNKYYGMRPYSFNGPYMY